MNTKATLAAIALMTGSSSAAIFVMNVSGTINSLQVKNVNGFPTDISDGSSFTASFSYDLDFWEWRDVGSSFVMAPIAGITNNGMIFTLNAGASQWIIDGTEFTYVREFLEVSNYRNGAFGTAEDSLFTYLAIISEASPAAFPFYLGAIDLQLYFSDNVDYDFVATHGQASNSNVILENVDSERMILWNHTLSGDQEWNMDLGVTEMSFSIVPEPDAFAISLGLFAQLILIRKRSNKPSHPTAGNAPI